MFAKCSIKGLNYNKRIISWYNIMLIAKISININLLNKTIRCQFQNFSKQIRNELIY